MRKKKKDLHRQDALHRSSSLLQHCEPARVVRHNQAGMQLESGRWPAEINSQLTASTFN